MNLPVRRLELAVHRLWQEDYLLVVPANHRLSSVGRAVALAEAASEPLIVIPGTPSTAALLAACEERGVAPRIVVETDTMEAVRRMVERGMGVSLLPRTMAQAADAGKTAAERRDLARRPPQARGPRPPGRGLPDGGRQGPPLSHRRAPRAALPRLQRVQSEPCAFADRTKQASIDPPSVVCCFFCLPHRAAVDRAIALPCRRPFTFRRHSSGARRNLGNQRRQSPYW